MENPIQNIEDERVLIEKLMQVGLASKRDEELTKFLDLHGNDFRLAITEHPELVDNFKINPNKTLREINNQYLNKPPTVH